MKNPKAFPKAMAIVSLFVALPMFAAAEDGAAKGGAAELDQVRKKVSAVFNGIDPENVQPSRIDGWYIIRSGTIIAYISADGKYLLQGDLYDIDTKINLTEETRKSARLEMMANVPDNRTIVFAPEDVKYSVSVFTDVDCTYCRRLHSQIDQYLAQGIKVRYLLYPRNGPESPSWTKAEHVWCAADRKKALTVAKLGQEVASETCDASIIHDHFELGQEVGLTGTPALVLDDGTLISGYLPPAELSERMAALAE